MNTKLLHTYFAGEATAEEEAKIMDWADLSPENYSLYLEERKRWNAFLVNYDSLRLPEVNKRSKRIRWAGVLAVAASVAILFILSRTFFTTLPPEDQWQSVWVPPGQRARIVLDDGTVIWLNSRSELSYPVSFTGGDRLVELNGEAYFDVKKDPDRLFVVKTGEYKVEVLGTEFNVFAYEDQDFFETSLLSGSLRVTSVSDEIAAVLLKPDERVTTRDGALVVSRIDHPDYFRWKEGLLCFDDERFEDIIRKFAICFDIKIVIENPLLKEYRYTGKFRQSDGVDYALNVLQRKQSFEYVRDNELNQIVIR